MNGGRRSRHLGLLARACPGCGAVGSLSVKELQDLRRVGPFKVRDREAYRVARCTSCRTVLPVRADDPLEGA